jgi:hypothetical protein
MLTEDRDKRYIEYLLRQNGFLMGELLVYSYKTSSNLEGAVLFVDFLREMAPKCKIIIHRDRDFMTPQEVEDVCMSITSSGALPFITRGSDIESYFVSPEHLQATCNISREDAAEWLDTIAQCNHNDLHLQFTRKRDEIKNKMYRKNKEECPRTLDLLGDSIPLHEDKRKGKFMLRKVRGSMSQKLGRHVELRSPSQALLCHSLQGIKSEVWPPMNA